MAKRTQSNATNIAKTAKGLIIKAIAKEVCSGVMPKV